LPRWWAIAHHRGNERANSLSADDLRIVLHDTAGLRVSRWR
jgi:hypothetical protein